MSVLLRFTPIISDVLRRSSARLFHGLSANCPAIPSPGGLFSLAVRYNIRDHFPRPSERKRIRTHGWEKRMSTRGGQKVIMHRILKKKHVITH